MKIANFFALFMLMALMLFCFGGCGRKNKNQSDDNGSATTVKYEDGEYSAAASEFDTSGYRPTVKVVIKDGEIQSVDCDADKKGGGTKKTESENGNYNMKLGGAQYEWHEEIAFFEEHVKENGVADLNLNDSGKTDAVAGCTIVVSEYVELINQALNKAKK